MSRAQRLTNWLLTLAVFIALLGTALWLLYDAVSYVLRVGITKVASDTLGNVGVIAVIIVVGGLVCITGLLVVSGLIFGLAKGLRWLYKANTGYDWRGDETIETLRRERDWLQSWAVALAIALALVLIRILSQPPIHIPHYTTTECVDANHQISPDAAYCISGSPHVHFERINHPRHYVSVLQYLLGNR